MEFYKLSGLDGMLPLKSFGTILGLLIFALTFMVEKERLPNEYLFLIFPLVSLTFFIKLYKKTDKKKENCLEFYTKLEYDNWVNDIGIKSKNYEIKYYFCYI